jgi:hypothetical protein
MGQRPVTDLLIFSITASFALAAALVCAEPGFGQTPSAAATSTAKPTPAAAVIQKPPSFGVIRIRVWPDGKPASRLQRKRFFLIKGSLDTNKALIDAMRAGPSISRECYYRSINASCALIKWLNDGEGGGCDSVYCRTIEHKYVEGNDAVPEFQTAYEKSKVEFKKTASGGGNLPLDWIDNNLPVEIRMGLYNKKKAAEEAFIKQAESISNSPVLSSMTDRGGSAFFTNIDPGTYVVSSLIPVPTATGSVLLNCEVTVTPNDIGLEKPFSVDQKLEQKNKKCFFDVKPVDPCEKEKPCK